MAVFLFFFSSRRRHTRWPRDWSSDVCSSDLGGMSTNDYFMQLQADILGINVERHSTEQVTSLGIAYLAGLAVGYWEDEAEIKKLKKRGTVFIPNNDNTEIQERSEEHTSELQSRGHL